MSRKLLLLLLPCLLLFAGKVQSDNSSLVYQKISSILRSKTISVDFEDMDFKEVIQFLHNVTGINFVVDPVVYSEKDVEDLKVTLRADDLPAGDVLNLILRFKGLGRAYRHGVLLISTKDRSSGKPTLKYYDVRDLTLKIQDFPGPDIELKGSDDGGMGGPAFPEDEGEDNTPTTESISELIRETCGQESWDEGSCRMTEINGVLLIWQTADVHLEILKLLYMLRGLR
jgi:hypothetical protein